MLELGPFWCKDHNSSFCRHRAHGHSIWTVGHLLLLLSEDALSTALAFRCRFLSALGMAWGPWAQITQGCKAPDLLSYGLLVISVLFDSSSILRY